MQDFILRQNAERFRARLAEARDEDVRVTLRAMLSTVERELALLEAHEAGARPRGPASGSADLEAARARLIGDFRERFEDCAQVAYLIDPGPGLRFVAVNVAFGLATGLPREAVEGQPLFGLFPDNPDEANADGTWLVFASMRKVAETGQPDAMPVMRYDVRNAGGVFEERHWRQLNRPLFSEDGRLVLLLHTVDEVTEEVLRARSSSSSAA